MWFLSCIYVGKILISLLERKSWKVWKDWVEIWIVIYYRGEGVWVLNFIKLERFGKKFGFFIYLNKCKIKFL